MMIDPTMPWETPALDGSDDSGEVRKSIPRSGNTGSARVSWSTSRISEHAA